MPPGLNKDIDNITDELKEKFNEEKLFLKNGIREPNNQMANNDTDGTDDASFVHNADDVENPINAMLAKRNKKRRFYKINDNGKRNRINLSPLASNGARIEKIIKQKTGLTRTGLVLVFLCIVLAIALLVCIIIWPKTAHSKEYPVCTKPSCLRSSAEVSSFFIYFFRFSNASRLCVDLTIGISFSV